ncbi:MAG TPA: serine/threonine protein kinase, partial [Planctomycetes bacterium]|nr:serine/threonine protein kinase [Planctomycetota bacterium]
GSPRYMAPEQARGEALDHRADIYALGATLYRMIAGVAPFDGASVKEIIRAKMDNDPTPLRRLVPEIPGGLSAVVQKMLARNPESRYDNADQVFSALDPSQYRKGISAKGKARVARATA